MAGAEPADCVPVEATDPLYILYTSGTTGQPKGIVRDNGGHAVALAVDDEEHLRRRARARCTGPPPTSGWVVGHSYIVYAPLLHGCTTVLYEGKPVGTPDAGAFWRVISEHGVSTLFTAPTAFRAIRQQDPDGEHIARYDLARFRALFLAGERCDPETLGWAERKLEVPVIDHWWQTETGWPIAANCLGIERAAGRSRLAHARRAGLGPRACWTTAGAEAAAGRDGRARCEAAHAARLLADALERRGALPRDLSRRRSPATTRRPTPATSTRTATSS